MTLLRVAWVTGMLVVAGGCEATHPAAAPADMHSPPPEQILVPAYLEAAPGTGVVSVTADAKSQYPGCTLEVQVDGRPVALLRASEGVVLHLPPGKHTFNVVGEGGNVCGPSAPSAGGVRVTQVTVAPDHPVDVRVGFDWSGRMHLTSSPSH
jgi:hypothetical protein